MIAADRGEVARSASAPRRRRARRRRRRAARDGRCPSRPTGPAGRRRPRPAPAPTAVHVVVVDLVARPRPVAGDRRAVGEQRGEAFGAHRRHPNCAATARNQRTTGSGSHSPATSTSARCRNSGTIGRLDLAGRPARLAEQHVLQPQDQRAERDDQPEHQHDREQRLAREARRHQHELGGEHAERRQAGDRDHAERKAHREHRMADRQALDVGDALRALDLRDVADREEDRRLGQRMHGHVQEAGEVRERPAHAEGEGDDAHVLDRRIGEQPFDVAAAVQHEGREHQADKAEHDHAPARH